MLAGVGFILMMIYVTEQFYAPVPVTVGNKYNHRSNKKEVVVRLFGVLQGYNFRSFRKVGHVGDIIARIQFGDQPL